MTEENNENNSKRAVEEPVVTEEPALPEIKKRLIVIKFNLFTFEKKLRASLSIMLRFLLIVSTLIAINFIHSELTNSNYSIQSISTPASFDQAGYSGTVIANKILYKLSAIIQSQSLADVATEYKNANRTVDVNVDLVGVGVPIRSITKFIGDALGIQNRKEINASITLDRDTLILDIDIAGDLERYEVLFTGSIESSLTKLTTKASEAILKHSSPYVLARYYLNSDSEGNYKLGKYLLSKYEGNPDIEPIGFFALAGSYFFKEDYATGEKISRKGLQKYSTDLNLNAALGTMLRLQHKFNETLAQDKKIIKMLTRHTPLHRVTLSYLNLGRDYGEMGSYDSAIYFGKRALEVNKNYEDSYEFLAEMYLQKSDTIEMVHFLKDGIAIGLTPEEYSGLKEILKNPKIKALVNDRNED